MAIESLVGGARVLFQKRFLLEFRGKCSSCGAATADLAGNGRQHSSALGVDGVAVGCRRVKYFFGIGC